jgi:hypothetical protein
MSRLHVPCMAPMMVAPLVVLQASLCLLHLLVGSSWGDVLSLSPCCFFTNMSPIAFIIYSSSMIAMSLSITVTSRFSTSTVKGLRTRSRRALNSSKVQALSDCTLVSIFLNARHPPAFCLSLANSARSFSFF